MPQKDFDLILKVQADLQNATKELRGLNDTMRVSNRSAKQASGGMDKLTRSTDKGERSVRGISRQLDGMSGSVKTAAGHLKTLAAVIGVAFVVHKVADWTRSLVDANEQLFQMAKMAEGLNVSVKFFAGMKEQADDLGVGVQQLSVVFGTLNRQIATAQRGSATAKGMFAEFGLDPDKIHSTEEAFLGVADSVEKYGLNAKRAGILTQLFGATGKQIVPILKQGADALRAQNDAMEKTGQIITDKDVPAITQLHNATDNIGDSFTALRNNLIIQLAPSISKIADQFNQFVTTHGPDMVKAIANLVDKLPELIRDFGDLATAFFNAAAGAAKFLHYASNVTGGAKPGDIPGLMVEQSDIQDELKQRARHPTLSRINTFLAGTENNALQNTLEGGRPRIQAMSDAELRARLAKIAMDIAAARLREATSHTQADGGGRPLNYEEMTVGLPLNGGGGGNAPANPAAAAAARQIAQQAAAAQTALTQALIDQKAKIDPTTAAWMAYSVAEGKANEEADALIKTHPKQAAAINATRNAQIELARIARDSKLDEIAKKDEAAWQSLLDSLRTPAEVNVDNALAQLTILNKRLQDGKISAAEYHDVLMKIADKSVGALPQYQGLDAAVGGIGSELTKNFQAQAELEKAYLEQRKTLRDKYRADDVAQEQLYQESLAKLDAQYAEQRNRIEQSRGQLALQTASGIFGQLAQLSSSHNTKMAEIGKAAAIAQAIINTYQSATAAYASLASIPYVGPALGAAAAAAAIAAGLANVAAIRAQPVGGYAEGGYTGRGGKYQVAGVVHKGEGVFSQRDIAALGGPGAFIALQRSLRGYADGGYVSGPTLDDLAPRVTARRMPSLASQSPADGGRASGPGVGVRIINSIDPEFATSAMNSAAGEKVIMNVLSRNATKLKQMVR